MSKKGEASHDSVFTTATNIQNLAEKLLDSALFDEEDSCYRCGLGIGNNNTKEGRRIKVTVTVEEV